MSVSERSMENIYNSKKLKELQTIAESESLGIEPKIVSDKIDEIVIFKLNEQNEKILKQNEKILKQNEKILKQNEKILKEKEDYEKTMSSFDNNKIFYDEISTPVFLIWTEEPLPMDKSEKKEYLKPKNLENKFNITLNFGCFLKFGPNNGCCGDNFYIVGHDKEIIELDLMDHDEDESMDHDEDESMNDIQYIVIPRQISKYLKDSLSFFGYSKNNHYSKSLKKMNRDSYEHSLDDSCVREIFEIGEFEFENHDVFLNNIVKNIFQESHIQFKYVLDICTYEYVLKCVIPILGLDNSLLKNDEQVIQGETGIVKTNDFNKLLEIQEIIKTQKITYQLSKCGPIEGDEDIKWPDDIEIVSIDKNEKNGDMNYDAVVKMTQYQYFKTQKQIMEHFAERIKARDETQVIFKQFKFISFYDDNVFIDI